MKLTSKHQERFIRTTHTWKGRAVGIQQDEIKLPNGKVATREFLTHPGAVGILAFPKPHHILLVKQYRYPMRQFTYEIPAGKLDKGEKPELCVRRELAEETGYQTTRIKKLVSFCPTAAFSDEVIHLYLALNATPGEPDPDEDEFLEVVTVSFRELDRLIQQGKIIDSKTLIAYLYWKNYLA